MNSMINLLPRTLLVSALALAVSACAVGPDYKAPQDLSLIHI